MLSMGQSYSLEPHMGCGTVLHPDFLEHKVLNGLTGCFYRLMMGTTMNDLETLLLTT